MMPSPLAFAWTTAWRDLRARPGRLVVYALSIALGVGAMTAVLSSSAILTSAIAAQSRVLLGSDLLLVSRRPIPDDAERRIAAIAQHVTRETSFRSMLRVEATGRTRLVQVRAFDGPFPLAGELSVDPPSVSSSFLADGAVLLDAALMRQFDVKTGDAVKLGSRVFTVGGAILRVPGEAPAEAFIAPRLFIAARELESTGLLLPGSVVTHKRHVVLPESERGVDRVRALREEFLPYKLDVETAERRKEQVTGGVDRLSRFFRLIGLLSLLLGCLGVAGATASYLRQKRLALAALLCLGATRWETSLVFLLQACVLAFAGSVVGAMAGAVGAGLLPRLLSDILPTLGDLPRWSPAAVAESVGTGFLFALAASAAPLLGLRHVTPLEAVRPQGLVPHHRVDGVNIVAGLILMALVAAAAALAMPVWWQGPAFAGGLALSLGLLAGVAAVLRWIARAALSRVGRFEWRQGAANLYRPDNQTLLVLTTLGLGVMLLTVVQAGRSSLTKRLAIPEGADQPNLVAIDLQRNQLDLATNIVREVSLPLLHLVPIVPMRLDLLKGRPVHAWEEDESAGIPDWALRREYRSTYRDELTATENEVAGFWPPAATPRGRVPVSLEADIADTLQVNLGDEIVWDIQGIAVTSVVSSLRQVDWQTMQPNFFTVFPTGVLERAPQTFALFTRAERPDDSARWQRRISDELPNVTVIDLSAVMASVNDMLGKVIVAIQAISLLTGVVGLAALAGSLHATKNQRRRENAVLHALGASVATRAGIVASEYVLLGSLAALAALALSLPASWAIARHVLEVPFTIDATTFVPALVLPLLTLVLGLLHSRVSPRHSTMEHLR